MSKKSSSKSKNNASTPTASKRATTAAAASEEKQKRPRKPPVDRALKLATLIGKKIAGLLKFVPKLKGPKTTEQQMAFDQVEDALEMLGAPARQLLENVQFLKDSDWKPTLSGLGRKPLEIGDAVALREKYYEEEIHGENDFAVAQITEKTVVIQSNSDESKKFPVVKAWLTRVGGVDDDDDEDNEEEGIANDNGDGGTQADVG
jgi:hypothetical protein